MANKEGLEKLRSTSKSVLMQMLAEESVSYIAKHFGVSEGPTRARLAELGIEVHCRTNDRCYYDKRGRLVKICTECKKPKCAKTEYGRQSATKPTPKSKCKACRRKIERTPARRASRRARDAKKRKADRLVGATEAKAKWKAAFQAQLRRQGKAEYYRKQKARSAIIRAIRRGTVRPRPCLVCGDLRSQGHHEDHDKRLEVTWLCSLHHSHVAMGYIPLPTGPQYNPKDPQSMLSREAEFGHLWTAQAKDIAARLVQVLRPAVNRLINTDVYLACPACSSAAPLRQAEIEANIQAPGPGTPELTLTALLTCDDCGTHWARHFVAFAAKHEAAEEEHDPRRD